MENMNFISGNKKREELQLPILYYVAADNWIDTLGEKTFSYWLKFVTFCNRQNLQPGEAAAVPQGMKSLAKRLGISYPTLQKVIKTLWNYGFIDLKEYDSGRETDSQKPVNIIVYNYPQNDITLATKELIKVRNYDTDYHSNAKHFGIQGSVKREAEKKEKTEKKGVEKKEKVEKKGAEKKEKEAEKNDKTAPLKDSTPGKINLTGGGKENLTPPVKNFLPNNVLNNLINVSKKLINDDDKEKVSLSPSQLELDILNIRKEYPGIKETVFNRVLNKCLDNLKAGKVQQTFNNYLRTALDNKQDELERKRKSYIEQKEKKKNRKFSREEVIPDWLGKEYETPNHTPEETAELDRKRAELLKQYEESKKNR